MRLPVDPLGTAVRNYLHLLDAESEACHSTRVLAQIRDCLQRHRATEPPVRLSAIAEAFNIFPRPHFDASVRDGELVFSAKLGSFLIRLNEKFRGANLLAGKWPDEMAAAELLGRGRFTYAHEFVHRFFYVHRDERWERACALAAQLEHDPNIRLRCLKALQDLEESICDDVAGEVLVPANLLVGVIGDSLVGGQTTAVPNVYELLRQISKYFNVSYDCALVRVERAIRRNVVSCHQDLCILFVEWSDRKGSSSASSSRRSRLDIRARVAVFPMAPGGLRVRRPFPGIAVENFGAEVRQLVDSVLRDRRPNQRTGGLDLAVRLQAFRPRDRSIEHQGRLRGYWARLGHQRADHPQDGRVLLWGVLEPALP